MSTPTPGKPSQALDFKSATLYAIRVVLHSADTASLIEALSQRMTDAGAFFENEPVVVDATRLDTVIDWPALLAALRGHRLYPVGFMAEGPQQEAALAAGLAPVELGGAPTRPASVPSTGTEVPVPSSTLAKSAETSSPSMPAAATPSDTPTPLPENGASGDFDASAGVGAPGTTPAPAAMVVTRPLRSGQRIYARDTDLIVIGVVSRGAEVIADGNIHVYGPLRGKAMAGARGDTQARIFTTQLDPELVSVAGVYRVIDTSLEPALQNKPAIVSLSGESLHIESLGN